MARSTKVFRVFISSTFTDMKEERSLLHRIVFPRLEKYCEKRGAVFYPVDLRWGVSEQSQLNQQTLEICLNEIRRCKEISPRPNFLLLLGDKYGWQPIPEIIPEKEFKAICKLADAAQLGLLDEWYILDENAIPAEYILKARSEEYSDYESWKIIENEIRNTLRNLVGRIDMPQDSRDKYYSSATHREIISGFISELNNKEKGSAQISAFVRHIDGLPSGPEAGKYIDIEDGERDSYSSAQLEELKFHLKKELGERYVAYAASWKSGDSVIDDPSAFADSIYSYLKSAIDQQLEQQGIVKEELEISAHGQFKNGLTEHFIGRTDILQELHERLSKSQQKALLLYGEPGSGKSSIIAQTIKELEEIGGDGVFVYRFAGATAESWDLISVLNGIIDQILSSYSYTIEDGEKDSGFRKHLSSVIPLFHEALGISSENRKLYVIIDALDHLADNSEIFSLDWIPKVLPAHTHILMSTTKEEHVKLNHFDSLRLQAMKNEDAAQILRNWLKVSGRSLTSDQFGMLMDKFTKTPLPIYLKVAFEISRKWHSFTSDYELEADLKSLINNFISELEKEHDRSFVQDTLSLLLCGRYEGLSEKELLEIHANDDELWNGILQRTHPDHRGELVEMRRELGFGMKMPFVFWSRLYNDLHVFLSEKEIHGNNILTFFHRQFIEIIGERYSLQRH